MKISVPIDVIPQGRPRFVNGRAIDPPKSRQFKQDLGMLVKSLRRESALLTCPLKIDLAVYRQASKFKVGVTAQNYGDVDNLVKGIFDALTGVLWEDDRQVVDLHITKNLADTPRVEIEVQEFQNRKQ